MSQIVSADDLSPANFVELLHGISWFENAGRPSPWDKDVVRIWHWSDWPGPDDPGVYSLGGQRYQAWRDAISEKHKTKRDELTLSSVWQETHDMVMRLAMPQVAQFSFDEDAWHAPTQSVWSAAWAASIINCYLTFRTPVPEELQRVWQWYVRGHWPCGYAKVPKANLRGELMVY